MTIAEILLQDFDVEMRSTRTTLERIPDVTPDFKPHEKSMPCGRLAALVATLCRFATQILTTDSLDLAAARWPPLVLESRQQFLADFDTLSAKARGHLISATDEQLQSNWKMSFGDRVITDSPRSLL